MKVAIVLISAYLATVGAIAQEVPSTAQTTGEVAGQGLIRPFFGTGPANLPKQPRSERPVEAERQVVEARSGGRAFVIWTTEYRPSAAEWRRQVTESMTHRQCFNHDATKTVVTESADRDTTVWTGQPADEAFGRLHDPLELQGALEAGTPLEGGDPAIGSPPVADEGVQRRRLPWTHQDGFGGGRMH